MDIQSLYSGLLLPLLRLVLTMCIGLLLASLLESLHWTRFVAKLAKPLARAGRLGDVAAASFALAFFSPAASNALLAERHATGELSKKELIFANLFNSSPTFLVHLPTLFSLAYAFLGTRAFVYVGLSFLAAALRTGATIMAGRLLLPARPPSEVKTEERHRKRPLWRETMSITLRRFKKRIGKLLIFTVPIYCVFFILAQSGVFKAAEAWLAAHAGVLSFLNPQAISIIALYLVSESGAAMSAAASLANAGTLGPHEIILALLTGNILSTPMRAIRHQFPSYAGYFNPALAALLVIMNQICRAASLILVAVGYYCY
ncbi:hypothetical protein LJC59_10290, partial [Desulfovibrio sp. OttesenSCG-928-A18]|nr:hypothetical protein [Desulfovibrio sp. OttesenSCG-928-A18]